MQPLKDLSERLKVLDPFLKRYGFELDDYENGNGSGGQFTVASYKCGRKHIIIGYRYSVGELAYQFGDFRVGHAQYIDCLGFADQKLFPDFQSDDKLLAFRHILHDFEFLIEDFFTGSCEKLIEAAKTQDNIVREANDAAHKSYVTQIDEMTIARARKKFKEQDYKGTLEVYATVEHKILFTDLDKKTIEYCQQKM